MRPLLFALTLSIVLAGSAHAQETADPRASLRHAVFAKLDLTSDEKQQLKQLHQQNEATEKQLRGQLGDAKKQWASALRADASDAEMSSLHTQLAQKREEYAAFRFNGLLAVRKILTPDQRRKFADLYIQFRKDRAARAAGLQ